MEQNQVTSALRNALDLSGISHAVICPGSRNAPLVRLLLSLKNIQCYSLSDERSAAFTAMGMALREQKPVVVCTTSGTAVLNLYPAICEAFYARIPLIALTADRPDYLIDQWDGQCIRQKGVFDAHIGASADIQPNSDHNVAFHEMRDLFHLSETKMLPVHLNVAFEEPLYDEIFDEVPSSEQAKFDAQSNKNVAHKQQFPPWGALPDLTGYRRIMVFYGAGSQEFTNINWPEGCLILSDVLAGFHHPATLNGWDTLLTRTKEDWMSPDLLITYGAYTLSKGLKQLLKMHPPLMHVHVDHGQGFGNMFQNEVQVIQDPENKVGTWIKKQLFPEMEWLEHWKSALNKSDGYSDSIFAKSDWVEFAVVAFLLKKLGNPIIHAANSMPVRYLSWLDHLTKKGRVYANRGASGIDGCTSTAVGFAMCTDEPVVLISGDIAFFYDINALWNNALPKNLKIIVLNNFGGSIFSHLDGPARFNDALKFQETPHSRNAEAMALAFGINYFCADSWEQLENIIPNFMSNTETCLLEIQTNKERNTAFYQQFKLWKL